MRATHGDSHPLTREVQCNLAGLLMAHNRINEAEPLLLAALAVDATLPGGEVLGGRQGRAGAAGLHGAAESLLGSLLLRAGARSHGPTVPRCSHGSPRPHAPRLPRPSPARPPAGLP